MLRTELWSSLQIFLSEQSFPVSVEDSPSFQFCRPKPLESATAMTPHIPSLLMPPNPLSHISSQPIRAVLVYLQNTPQIWSSFTNFTAIIWCEPASSPTWLTAFRGILTRCSVSALLSLAVCSHESSQIDPFKMWVTLCHSSAKTSQWLFHLTESKTHVFIMTCKTLLNDCPYLQPFLSDLISDHSPSCSRINYPGLLIFPWTYGSTATFSLAVPCLNSFTTF